MDEAIKRASDDKPIIQAELGGDVAKQGGVLYHMLVTTIKGPALSLVKLTKRGEGLEAIRKIYHEYRPRIEEDFAEQLAQILKPEWWLHRRGQLSQTS